jgi:hypothetical protein
VIVVFLWSCGGGGGGSSPSTTLDISGTAATGSPFTGGTIQIYDADGKALLSTAALVASDGTYKATLAATVKFPLVFVADDGQQKIISVLASGKDTATVNVTQLTTLIASRLSATGDPGNRLAEIAAGTAVVSSAKVSNATTEVLKAIKPALDALGLPATDDPISKAFLANGKGADKLLDVLDVKIEPKGTSSTIEITVKQISDEGAALPVLTVDSSLALPALPAIKAADMPDDGLSVALQRLLDQSTKCYALPRETRINADDSIPQWGASEVKAAECKSMFFGKDPSKYKSGGHFVADGDHFSGIFNATKPVVFSAPRYYYTVGTNVPSGPSAGDVVFGFRWLDENGNYQYEKNVVRLDTDGNYRFLGNQYSYQGGVMAYSSHREYINQPTANFDSVGYAFDTQCGQGKNWKKVNVISPAGHIITLVPSVTGGICNYGYLVIAGPKTKDSDGDNSDPLPAGMVRIKTVYSDAAKAAQDPGSTWIKSKETRDAFRATEFTEAEIEKIPQFGTWRFDYYTNRYGTPNFSQYYKTIARAMTISGFRKSVKLPKLPDAYVADLKAKTQWNGLIGFVSTGTGPYSVSWEVNPASKADISPPATYRAAIYGAYGHTNSRQGYEDHTFFGSSSRKTDINCNYGNPSARCENVNGVFGFATTSKYDMGSNVQLILITSRMPDGSDADIQYSLKKLE